MNKKDLVIIGGGSAGMSAALEAYRLGITDILIIEKNPYLGGILNQCIHNGFGIHEFNEELTGPEFLTRFSDKILENNIEVELDSVVVSISRNKVVRYSNKKGFFEIEAKTIIFAAGCYEKNAGAINLPGDRSSGIVTAGQAQLYLNKYGALVGKKVFILGSGDIGLIMARRMTLEGAQVIGVAELNSYSAGLNRNIQQCLLDFNIPLYLSHTVKKVIGKKRLEKIILAQVDEKFNFIPDTDMEIECDVLLLSVGLVPNCDLFTNLPLTYSRTRGVISNQYCESEMEGLFTCGNVLHVHDLVDYVVQEAREAAFGAYLFLDNKINHDAPTINVKNGNGVLYVIPQIVLLDNNSETVTFKFRVNKPYKDINIVFKLNDSIIKKVYKLAIVPSEMEQVKIPYSLLVNNGNQLEVYVEEKK